MTLANKIDKIWDGLRDAIDAAYQAGRMQSDDARQCLRDYARNISWSDNLETLLDAETNAERRHRSGRPADRWKSPISSRNAAKLLLCHNALEGSNLQSMPYGARFLVIRKTAAEAEVIGYLIRDHVTPEWRELVSSLDYAEIMKAGY